MSEVPPGACPACSRGCHPCCGVRMLEGRCPREVCFPKGRMSSGRGWRRAYFALLVVLGEVPLVHAGSLLLLEGGGTHHCSLLCIYLAPFSSVAFCVPLHAGFHIAAAAPLVQFCASCILNACPEHHVRLLFKSGGEESWETWCLTSTELVLLPSATGTTSAGSRSYFSQL